MKSDILEVLRRETVAWHLRVEASVRVMEDGFTPADYVWLLGRFYGFYAPQEESLARISCLEALLPDWRKRLKAPSLLNDLRWLGQTETQIGDIPTCPAATLFDNPEEVFGFLYVTEGSTLGGQIISRHINKSLGLSSGAGASFFNGHGQATGSMWKSFIKVLQRIDANGDQRKIVDAAKRTFEIIWYWLSGSNASQMRGFGAAEGCSDL